MSGASNIKVTTSKVKAQDPPVKGKSELEETTIFPAQIDPPDILSQPPIPMESFPDKSQNPNRTLATIPNVKHIFAIHGLRSDYDIIKKAQRLLFPGLACPPELADETSYAALASLASLNRMSTANLPLFINAIASQNPINAPLNWITFKSWDGVNRYDLLANTIEIPEDFPLALRNTIIIRWIYSAVAAVYMPTGFRARGVLVLQGQQGLGKTTWILRLIDRDDLRDLYLKTGHHLDPSNKDSLIIAVSHWIVEIGELDSSFKKDIARLKGFLSEGYDKVRLPYARRESEYPRRTVFCASVNEESFLVDPTGNTRFWTIPATKIDYGHKIDMQQLFAQALVDVKAGAQWWLTPDEEALLEESNKGHRAINAIGEMILDAFDFELPKDKWSKKSAIEILRHIDIKQPTNAQCKDAAAALRELEYKIGRSTKSQGKTRWLVPIEKPPLPFGRSR